MKAIYGNIAPSDTVWFMIQSKAYSAVVKSITHIQTKYGVETHVEIDKNPAGARYTTHFGPGIVYETKELLLKSL